MSGVSGKILGVVQDKKQNLSKRGRFFLNLYPSRGKPIKLLP